MFELSDPQGERGRTRTLLHSRRGLGLLDVSRAGFDGTAYRPTQIHNLPSHSSTMVLSTVKKGPPRFCNSFLQGPSFHPGWASLDPDGEAGFGA